MTNKATGAKGLDPVTRDGDEGFHGACTIMEAPSTYATDLFKGDPVIKVSAGSNAAYLPYTGHTGGMVGFRPGTLPEVNLATAGSTNKISGVIHDFGYDPNDKNTRYGKASTSRGIAVVVDPSVTYEVVSNGATGAATDVGSNANLASGTGSTVTALSGWVLDSTSVNSQDATMQLLVVGISRDPYRNDLTSANPSYLVKINLHTQMSYAIAGI